ncbi:MAG: hypothetical protein R3E32_02220 [Chitinophagales bacterium]
MFEFNKVSISKLFEEELYSLKTEEPSSDVSNADKKIALVANYAKDEFPKIEWDLLEKILKAAKVDMEQVAIFHAQTESFSFKSILEQTQSNRLIVFGLKPSSLGLNIRLGLYQLLTFRGCQILLADDLTTISKDVQRKTYLWRNLQKMFEL